MKIKIDEKNADKIAKALAAVNGKATAFTITHYSELATIAARAEKQLEDSKLSKADRIGAEVTFRPAGPTAAKYKYVSKSTTVRLTRGSSSWYLTKVSEAAVYPRGREHLLVSITPAQRDLILALAITAYRVITQSPEQTQGAGT